MAMASGTEIYGLSHGTDAAMVSNSCCRFSSATFPVSCSYFRILSENSFSKTFTLPFSLTDLADYLAVNRSAMQRELKKKLEALGNEEFEVSKSGAVKVVVLGNKKIKSVQELIKKAQTEYQKQNEEASIRNKSFDKYLTENEMILIEKETAPITYEMAAVSIGDVQKTQKLRCSYQQVNDETLSFSISGKRVAEVYVEGGESVVKGQILAELDVGNAQDQIRTLEYNIARNELNLKNSAINEQDEISAVWLRFLFQSGKSAGDQLGEHREVADDPWRERR